MACESYFKVKLIFLSNLLKFGPPQGGPRLLGPGTSGHMGILHFGIENAAFPNGFLKVLQNRACVPAMKKSPKGGFLHNNHHDNVI